MNDLNAYTEEQACKIIEGSARSMGVKGRKMKKSKVYKDDNKTVDAEKLYSPADAFSLLNSFSKVNLMNQLRFISI